MGLIQHYKLLLINYIRFTLSRISHFLKGPGTATSQRKTYVMNCNDHQVARERLATSFLLVVVISLLLPLLSCTYFSFLC